MKIKEMKLRIPETLYNKIKKEGAKHERSINKEVIYTLRQTNKYK